jgi:hypothetical protein
LWGNVRGNLLLDFLHLARLPRVRDLFVVGVLRGVSCGRVGAKKVLLTYGPATSLDLYFSISFPSTFFMAYFATSCVMVAVVSVENRMNSSDDDDYSDWKTALYDALRRQGHKELAAVRLSERLSGRVVGLRRLLSRIVKRARRCPMYSRQVRLRNGRQQRGEGDEVNEQRGSGGCASYCITLAVRSCAVMP